MVNRLTDLPGINVLLCSLCVSHIYIERKKEKKTTEKKRDFQD